MLELLAFVFIAAGIIIFVIGFFALTRWWNREFGRFCPNCGSRMFQSIPFTSEALSLEGMRLDYHCESCGRKFPYEYVNPEGEKT